MSEHRIISASGTMRSPPRLDAIPTVRPSAMSRPRSDCDAGPNSQNLRRISCLWIKLEQFSQVSRKSLTPLSKIASEAVEDRKSTLLNSIHSCASRLSFFSCINFFLIKHQPQRNTRTDTLITYKKLIRYNLGNRNKAQTTKAGSDTHRTQFSKVEKTYRVRRRDQYTKFETNQLLVDKA